MRSVYKEFLLVAILIAALIGCIKLAEYLISHLSFNQAFAQVTQNIQFKLSSQAVLGEKVFKANCAVCHGAKGQGASGPQNNDASLELLKAKVLTGSYPPGYKPKRTTRIMPRFPHLKDKIEAIYQYLQEVK